MNLGYPEGPYAIHWLPSIVDKLKLWARQAQSEGFSLELAEALKRLVTKLKFHPNQFGDYLWTYKQRPAVERRGIIPNWFCAGYFVSDEAKQIIVRTILPAPGSRLL